MSYVWDIENFLIFFSRVEYESIRLDERVLVRILFLWIELNQNCLKRHEKRGRGGELIITDGQKPINS